MRGLSHSFDVAQRALAAAAESADGRGPPTQLLPAILRRLQLTTPDELIGWWVSAHSAPAFPMVRNKRRGSSPQPRTDPRQPCPCVCSVSSSARSADPRRVRVWGGRAYGTSGWAHVAALAPVVCEQAHEGDAAAILIVDGVYSAPYSKRRK